MSKPIEPQLIKSRTSLKSTLTRIQNFVQRFSDEDNIEQLNLRNEKLEYIWSKYDEIQTKLEVINSNEYSDDRELLESQYFDTKVLIKDIIKKRNFVPSSHAQSVAQDIKTKVNLPKLSIPHFSGDYQEWLSFYDLFKSLVHENKNISNIEKLFYLKSALRGEAAKIIESISVSADNYSEAFKLLEQRYDNKLYIINSHLKELFSLSVADSTSTLRNLLTRAKQQIGSLRALKVPIDNWDIILTFLICQKLDIHTKREWELKKNKNEIPTLNQFLDFLEHRCLSLEAVTPVEFSKVKPKPKTFSHLTSTSSNPKPKVECSLCQKHHMLYACDTFHSLNINDRINAIKTARVCFNCLNPGHGVKNCTAKSCKKCGRRHSTLIHFDQQKSDMSVTQQPTKCENVPDNIESNAIKHSNEISLHNLSEPKQVLLSTAILKVKDHAGSWINCRVLLDSGSQSNFATSRLVKKLQIKTLHTNVRVTGINCTNASSNSLAKLTIASRVNSIQYELDFLILDTISSEIPYFRVNCSKWPLPNNCELADPSFNEPGEIDLLIGAEVYLSILKVGQFKLGRYLPIMQNTTLGWIFAGKVSGQKQMEYNSKQSVFLCCEKPSTDDLLLKFWELENISATVIRSKEEQECEEFFKTTTSRDKHGRYIVKLHMWNDIDKPLGNSYNMTRRRLDYLLGRLQRNPHLRDQYQEFLDEYLSLDHMEIADDLYTTDNTYYLPHHAVIKESSTTTKLRVVFDASMKTETGVSLNDKLKIGPTVQQDLLSILLRFRLHKYAFTADIKKMYRQILVDKSHTNLQLILWKGQNDTKITTYRLKTVTYGTASAPYLATRCLQQLAYDDGDSFPLAKTTLLEDFYVDDVMTGGDRLEEVLELQKQLISLLNKGGFELHKWCSNNREILSNVDESVREIDLSLLIEKQSVKTLGLLWLPSQDKFKFVVNLKPTESLHVFTKRAILSDIATIFDPFGLLGPVIIRAKIFMQKLWKEKTQWDESLSARLTTEWMIIRKQLQELEQVQVNRRMNNLEHEDIEAYELHGYCDASQGAYGACVYLKVKGKRDKVSIQLIAAKSRVAPIKHTSIPRLELCGAVILSRLIEKVKTSLQFKQVSIHLWTDSTITLSWIKGEAYKWKTFVANRVSEIQELTNNCKWHYVPTEENPADYLSRGLATADLKRNTLWWHGPNWLKNVESAWPKMIFSKPDEGQLEKKSMTVFTSISTLESELINKFSTFTKLKRVFAYSLRFIQIVKSKNHRITGPLTLTELQISEHTLIKCAQSEEFHHEIETLSSNTSLLKGPLKSLNPFIDQYGLLRVGGRIQNATVNCEQKHQIILPRKHKLTILILEFEHKRLLHAGTQAVLGSIREKFWPIQGRKTLRKIINNCITCYRYKTEQCSQLMGNLPSYRTRPTRAFLNSGVDYTGPVYIKVNSRKNASTVKSYIALFICLVTRAIHIELVSNLSTEAFISALKRFYARRGRCAVIHSDNATNFKGANHELRELFQIFKNEITKNQIINFASTSGTEWKFIPPNAPHFGGIWEAGIKSIKYHLKRVIGKMSLTFEELYTVLTEIEACINSRPLTPLYDDPSDFSVLTPAHFLVGGPLTAIPEPNLIKLSESRLSNWQSVQKQVQVFWKRWSKDYLNTLQQRSKWQISKPNVLPGSLVLIRDDNQPPMNWAMGRIEEVFPGPDGRVRVVRVITSSGKYKRPVTKLCLLPIADNTF